MSTDVTEPLDLAPIKAGLANYASGPENDLTGHMIARDLAHAVPSLVAEVERLRAEMATIAEAHKPIWVDGPAPVCIECGHEHCPTRAALEAALGVGS